MLHLRGLISFRHQSQYLKLYSLLSTETSYRHSKISYVTSYEIWRHQHPPTPCYGTFKYPSTVVYQSRSDCRNAELNMRNSDTDEVLLNESSVLRACITRKIAMLTLGVKRRVEQFTTKNSRETNRFTQTSKLFQTMFLFIKAPYFQRTSKRWVGGCSCENFWIRITVAVRYVKFRDYGTTLYNMHDEILPVLYQSFGSYN